MGQKIIKIGSSVGVTLSSEVLKSAGLKPGDNVQVGFDESRGSITVESAQVQEFAQEVAAASRLVQKYQEELRKLDAE